MIALARRIYPAVTLCLFLAASHAQTMGAATVPLNTLQLNGRAGYNGRYIVLTFDISQSASAFVPVPYAFGPKDSFVVDFVYIASEIAGQTPADGLVFVMQNTPAGPNFLEGSGSNLGFIGPLQHAVGVAFDYYQNEVTGTPPNTVAVELSNGTVLSQVVPTLNLVGGTSPRYVRITYSNLSGQMKIWVSDTPTFSATPTLQQAFPNLSGALGGQIYMGVTAGTGSLYTYQSLNSLSINVVNN